MRLGLQLGYDDPVFWAGLAEEAERCGFHSVWTSEAYGSDAVSPLAWVGSRTTKVRLMRCSCSFGRPCESGAM